MTGGTTDTTSLEDAGFGIYVHWPFCLAKCPYCDFNSHVRHAPVDQVTFADALCRELDHMAGMTVGYKVSSVFFGGGTPSLMAPDTVARILDTITKRWTVAADTEITLEANPTSAEAENFRGYRSAGVNRVSVGVQALCDQDLKALGRQHTADEALQAFRTAASVFPRTSFDLIYARPGQTVADWRDELSRALAEQQGHMSLYQLTIEPGTPFADLHDRGRLQVPRDDLAADLFDVTQELTDKAGLPAYEVSNHARPGQESRHNLIYWRYGLYAGVGPGAHSRLLDEDGRRVAMSGERHPETWRDRVTRHGHGIVERSHIDTSQQADEYLVMGMRVSDGIDLKRYERIGGTPIDPVRIKTLVGDGLIRELPGNRIAATRSGMKVLNAVIGALSG